MHTSALSAKETLNKLLLEKKNKEMELQQNEELIKKHSFELNSVKTNDAYKALLNEIEFQKNSKNDVETSILEILDDIDKENENLKLAKKELEEKEVLLKEEIKKYEQHSVRLKDEIEVQSKERDEFAAGVDSNLLDKYEFIRESRQGFAVVPVVEEDESCGGCHLRIRAQIINDVYKCHDIIFCDNCQRILYKKEDL